MALNISVRTLSSRDGPICNSDRSIVSKTQLLYSFPPFQSLTVCAGIFSLALQCCGARVLRETLTLASVDGGSIGGIVQGDHLVFNGSEISLNRETDVELDEVRSSLSQTHGISNALILFGMKDYLCHHMRSRICVWRQVLIFTQGDFFSLAFLHFHTKRGHWNHPNISIHNIILPLDWAALWSFGEDECKKLIDKCRELFLQQKKWGKSGGLVSGDFFFFLHWYGFRSQEVCQNMLQEWPFCRRWVLCGYQAFITAKCRFVSALSFEFFTKSQSLCLVLSIFLPATLKPLTLLLITCIDVFKKRCVCWYWKCCTLLQRVSAEPGGNPEWLVTVQIFLKHTHMNSSLR